MDFSKNSVHTKLRKSNSFGDKFSSKIILLSVKLFVILMIVCVVGGVSLGWGIFKGIIDEAPEIDIASIEPSGFATMVYDSQGNLTETLVQTGSNRLEATYEELPDDLINAFVAIEDSRFWTHSGIDLRSIIRMIVGVLTNDSSGGGSTITQQLIKNNVFDGGNESSFGETVERKIQEQYLAVELEKVMDKKLIMKNYLNTINLGNNTLGVKSAALRYFNKDVSDLTLSECTVIAGITQNPTKYNPLSESGRVNNAEKREVILEYMYEQGYITKEEQEEALADDVYSRIQYVDIVTKEETESAYSYFTDELIEQVLEALQEQLGYSETQAYNLLYSGGLEIYTTQDPDIQAIVDEEINNEANYDVAYYSVDYRLSILHEDGTQSNYSTETMNTWIKQSLGNSSFNGLFSSRELAEQRVDEYREAMTGEGDTVIGESAYYVLEPQASFVIMDQSTGYVKAISGGRGKKEVSRSLNRATNTLRQPGSAFKVITSFAPAIDACGATLATVYYDAPYTVGDKTFKNWYSSGYLGYANIRDGIAYSMNIIAVRCMMETVTPELGVDYARRMGITSLTEDDYNAATALGGITKGVSNLELTAAYATIANGGVYNKPKFYTKILDHNGKVILDNTAPESTRVLKDSTAYLLTSAMEDVMQSKRMFSSSGINLTSTSPSTNIPNMSNAGKSGTTSNNNDVWFVGYTPYYTAGIWCGCDDNQHLTNIGSGTSFHKTIWQKIMTRVHEELPDIGFEKPDSITTREVCRKSGKLPVSRLCSNDPRGSAVYTEYFAVDNVPTEECDHHEYVTVCSESGALPTQYCPSTYTSVRLVLPEGEEFESTDDSNYAKPNYYCTIHTADYVPEDDGEDTDDGSEDENESIPSWQRGPGWEDPSG